MCYPARAAVELSQEITVKHVYLEVRRVVVSLLLQALGSVRGGEMEVPGELVSLLKEVEEKVASKADTGAMLEVGGGEAAGVTAWPVPEPPGEPPHLGDDQVPSGRPGGDALYAGT